MSKYNNEMIKRCADWVRINGLMEHGGAKLVEFCKAMNINDMTYYAWMRKSAFYDAIKKAKDEFATTLEPRIVQSLANAAIGQEYTQTQAEYKIIKGEKVLVRETTKNIKIEPNVGAGIFLLTNIAPERWKNRQQRDVDVSCRAKPMSLEDAKEALKAAGVLTETADDGE